MDRSRERRLDQPGPRQQDEVGSRAVREPADQWRRWRHPAVAEKPAPTGKKRGRKPKVKARDQGKTSFIKEFLNDHPEGNVKAVNEAWTKAGFDGSISNTLVSKMRAQLGLTGNLRSQAGEDQGGFGDEALHRQEAGQEAEGAHRRGDTGHCDS